MEAALGLPADALCSPWGSLSGGQRQRAAIACSLLLAQDPMADPRAEQAG